MIAVAHGARPRTGFERAVEQRLVVAARMFLGDRERHQAAIVVHEDRQEALALGVGRRRREYVAFSPGVLQRHAEADIAGREFLLNDDLGQAIDAGAAIFLRYSQGAQTEPRRFENQIVRKRRRRVSEPVEFARTRAHRFVGEFTRDAAPAALLHRPESQAGKPHLGHQL